MVVDGGVMLKRFAQLHGAMHSPMVNHPNAFSIRRMY